MLAGAQAGVPALVALVRPDQWYGAGRRQASFGAVLRQVIDQCSWQEASPVTFTMLLEAAPPRSWIEARVFDQVVALDQLFACALTRAKPLDTAYAGLGLDELEGLQIAKDWIGRAFKAEHGIEESHVPF